MSAQMTDVLAEICAAKLKHVAQRQSEIPMERVKQTAKAATPPRGFANRLVSVAEQGRYALICEIKKASPSGGLLRRNFVPPELAKAYESAGAACLSVLTDTPYFQGNDNDLVAARNACGLPVLRKDFMLAPYQIYESRALGADCVLLIMAALDDAAAAELETVAAGLGMDVLVEVHDEAELDRALELQTKLVGINNRNLKTLKTDLETTELLARKIPDDRLLVSESGIRTEADLARLSEAGADAFLVGESLMRHQDVRAATIALTTPAAVGSGAAV